MNWCITIATPRGLRHRLQSKNTLKSFITASGVIHALAMFRQRCSLNSSANSRRRLETRVSAIDSTPHGAVCSCQRNLKRSCNFARLTKKRLEIIPSFPKRWPLAEVLCGFRYVNPDGISAKKLQAHSPKANRQISNGAIDLCGLDKDAC